jgi:hypothetical protein
MSQCLFLCWIRWRRRRNRSLHDPFKVFQREGLHQFLNLFRGNQEFSFPRSLFFFGEFWRSLHSLRPSANITHTAIPAK